MQTLLRGLTTEVHIFSKHLSKYCKQNVRLLNLLEYDSKKLLRKSGINIQNFMILQENDDIDNAIQNIDFKTDNYVIKAQISAGGRKLGVFDNGYRGIHIVNKADIKTTIQNMIGHRLTTKQTSPSGVLVKKVMIAEFMKIRQESYFCILLDSAFDGPIIIASRNGGTDIEEIYKENNNTIKIFPIDITKGIDLETSRKITTCLGFNDKLYDKANQQITAAWNLFTQYDAIQLEINPLTETEDDEIVAIDAKITLDDNALFRHNFTKSGDEDLDERERKAAENNMNYVGLDGNIGCLVNGAGLAMATMDILKLYGGKPANFLDVGGGADEKQICEAMKMLMTDKHVKSILINIFGGIVDCTTIANGIIQAMKDIDNKIVVTVRFQGNNVENAKQMIAEFDSDFKISFADDLHEAAQLAIKSI